MLFSSSVEEHSSLMFLIFPKPRPASLTNCLKISQKHCSAVPAQYPSAVRKSFMLLGRRPDDLKPLEMTLNVGIYVSLVYCRMLFGIIEFFEHLKGFPELQKLFVCVCVAFFFFHSFIPFPLSFYTEKLASDSVRWNMSWQCRILNDTLVNFVVKTHETNTRANATGRDVIKGFGVIWWVERVKPFSVAPP